MSRGRALACAISTLLGGCTLMAAYATSNDQLYALAIILAFLALIGTSI